MPKVPDIQDAPVFSYRIASADMRYIEIGVREIYLRNDPEVGLVFRGEISGCGADCFENLSEILLEYALSCEGCQEPGVSANEVARFGEHLAGILLAKTRPKIVESPPIEKLSHAFKVILNSMNANYVQESQADRLSYTLDCCPLSECASRTGLRRNVEMAHISLIALCKRLIKALAPDWALVQPSEDANDLPLVQIVIARLQEI